MKIFILLTALLSFSVIAQTRQETISADCVRIQDGVCIDKDELGYLDGSTSNIQDQLDDVGTDLSTHASDTTTHGTTGDVVGTSDTQALSNKTIDADSNTITNIENADIKAGAAIDAAKIHDGSISNTEYGYLNGASSNIQTQITTNAATETTNDGLSVHKAGTETITGEKTFTGQMDATSTTFGNRVCPVMTDSDMLEIVAPVARNGDCVYNSTKKGQYVYSSADAKWKPNGGGAGGSRLNLLLDSSFEDGVTADGSCATCTASQESTIILATPFNEKALKINFAAQNGCYTVDKTTGSEFSGSQGLVSAFLKTSITGATFTSRVNGVDTSDVVTISNRDAWDYYQIPVVLGTTSVGYKICSGSSVTDDIYGDETFVGPAKVTDTQPNIGPATAYTPTLPASWGTTSNVKFYWRQNGSKIEVDGSFTVASTTTGVGGIPLPTGYTINSSYYKVTAT